MEAKKYNKDLAGIATKLAMEYFVVVNFVCLPSKEFSEKKTWYPYFKNIVREGEVLQKEAFKSANNRAFYAIEKSIKALLATKEMDVTTHSGGLKQFNFLFIYNGDGTFTAEDYQKIAHAEQIRNASDYDDFYITSKEEAKCQVEDAEYLVNKVDEYVASLYKE